MNEKGQDPIGCFTLLRQLPHPEATDVESYDTRFDQSHTYSTHLHTHTHTDIHQVDRSQKQAEFSPAKSKLRFALIIHLPPSLRSLQESMDLISRWRKV